MAVSTTEPLPSGLQVQTFAPWPKLWGATEPLRTRITLQALSLMNTNIVLRGYLKESNICTSGNGPAQAISHAFTPKPHRLAQATARDYDRWARRNH